MNKALALLEFDSVATGVLAVDRMLKQAPGGLVALRHRPSLASIWRWSGASVAATEEAHAVGVVSWHRQNGRA
jgi:hypothetical protein